MPLPKTQLPVCFYNLFFYPIKNHDLVNEELIDNINNRNKEEIYQTCIKIVEKLPSDFIANFNAMSASILVKEWSQAIYYHGGIEQLMGKSPITKVCSKDNNKYSTDFKIMFENIKSMFIDATNREKSLKQRSKQPRETEDNLNDYEYDLELLVPASSFNSLFMSDNSVHRAKLPLNSNGSFESQCSIRSFNDSPVSSRSGSFENQDSIRSFNDSPVSSRSSSFESQCSNRSFNDSPVSSRSSSFESQCSNRSFNDSSVSSRSSSFEESSWSSRGSSDVALGQNIPTSPPPLYCDLTGSNNFDPSDI